MISGVPNIPSLNSLLFHYPKEREKSRQRGTKEFGALLAKLTKNPPRRLAGKLMM